MGSVKTPSGVGTVAGRIRLIRQRLNPHGQNPISWEEFAAFAGRPVGTVKKWESRSMISADSAEDLAQRLAAAGLAALPAWIRRGSGTTPGWATSLLRMPQDEGSASSASPGEGVGSVTLRVLASPSPASTEIVARIEHAVGRAVERVLARDELHKTRAGRSLLRRALRLFARELNEAAQMDVHELLDVIGDLED